VVEVLEEHFAGVVKQARAGAKENEFPTHRPRRLRRNEAIRSLVREHGLHRLG